MTPALTFRRIGFRAKRKRHARASRNRSALQVFAFRVSCTFPFVNVASRWSTASISYRGQMLRRFRPSYANEAVRSRPALRAKREEADEYSTPISFEIPSKFRRRPETKTGSLSSPRLLFARHPFRLPIRVSSRRRFALEGAFFVYGDNRCNKSINRLSVVFLRLQFGDWVVRAAARAVVL